jgi:hypothetical protein
VIAFSAPDPRNPMGDDQFDSPKSVERDEIRPKVLTIILDYYASGAKH